ncbi:hypothetical protein B7494_g806 [Chlorociboria aeruginascens]|nr:hypothetical protein B7494_g806 [Chlorociboria aeruginascens]
MRIQTLLVALNPQTQEIQCPRSGQSTQDSSIPQAQESPNSQNGQHLADAFSGQYDKTQQEYSNSQHPKAPTPILAYHLSTEENELMAYRKMQTYQYVSKYGHELSKNCKWWLKSEEQPWEHRFGHWDGKTWAEVLRILEQEKRGCPSMTSEERAVSAALKTAAAKCNDKNSEEIFKSVREFVRSSGQSFHGKVSPLPWLQSRERYLELSRILRRDYDKISDYIVFIECETRRVALERQIKNAIHNTQKQIFGDQGIPSLLREREGEEDEDLVWAPVKPISKRETKKMKKLALKQAQMKQEAEYQTMAASSSNGSTPPMIESRLAEGWIIVGWQLVCSYTSEMVPVLQGWDVSPPARVTELLAQGKRLAGWSVMRPWDGFIDYQPVHDRTENLLPQVKAPPPREQRIAGWFFRRPDGTVKFEAIQDRAEEGEDEKIKDVKEEKEWYLVEEEILPDTPCNVI